MKDLSFTEIVQVAIRKEEESEKFYQKAARMAYRSGIREMFLELAGEEAGHRKLLLGLGSGSAPEGHPEDVPDLRISEYLVEPPLTETMHYDEILRMAMKREEKAVHLYEHLLAKVQDEEGRKLVTYLLEQEHRHKFRLEGEYDENVLEEN
ncbi:MAG: rubrerythrin [Desulfuromonas sp.]|uniref:ferritin family protein n=1 Tax=Desulfuromonas sp. TaxID=892 RepID=UPI000CAB02C7|nr:ferritin family protein [Desulfuromonas sp.]PLX84595.1 MAG: rubrerythrin [Desulfuromonas sp.]